MSLQAGVATREINPHKPLFLCGYPHVPRTSTGVHDPLLASAFYVADQKTELLTIALDLIFVTHEQARDWRTEIERACGIPAAHILLSATHTHSGPVTAGILAFRGDPVVPPADPDYLALVKRGVIEAAVAAKKSACPARLAVTSARAEDVGCNRLDPNGPHDPEVGLLFAKRADNGEPVGVLAVYSMHPTVLHEDSTLVSSDFIAYTRQQIEEAFPGVKVVYHSGACGNLSTRYHVKGQTFAEAERLGRRLGAQVQTALRAVPSEAFQNRLTLAAARTFLEPTFRRYPSLVEAEKNLARCRAEYERLKREGAPRARVRTAECVVFGAEELVTFARAEADGEANAVRKRYGQLEVQVLRVGDCFLVGLPGEFFVEYGLEIKRRAPGRAFVITLANGELQGYLVTPEAEAAGGYEAQLSFFPAALGGRFVETAVRLMQQLRS